MKNQALSVAGILFLLVAIGHFYRYAKAFEVTFNHFVIPVQWSLYAGVIIALIAIWMFVAAKK